MIENVAKIKTLREEKKQIEAEIKELTTPLITDQRVIPIIYDWFKEILSGRTCPPRPESAYQRKKFLFIILKLYCPGFFTGDKMPSGLRRELAKCLHIASGSTISTNCSDILFIHSHYKNFSSDIETLYAEIVDRLTNRAHPFFKSGAPFF
jgi:hypothetical protein